MNTLKITRFALVVTLAGLLFAFMLTGCSKENSLEPKLTTSITSNADVAESVAGAVGDQSGGIVDQVGDILDLTSAITLGKTTADGFLDHREASYDETTGLWTVILQRERGLQGKAPYGYWDRTFTFKFLNINGLPQKNYVTSGDTARTIHFNIVQGDGYQKNFRMSHDLKELQGAFIVTNVHTKLVTVNGTYHRAAVDTITTQSFTRTSDHVLQVTVIDLVGPVGSRRDLSQKISGSIIGTFHADIVFDGKRGYAEKTVDKNINIVISSGEAEIAVDGQQFICNIETGQIK